MAVKGKASMEVQKVNRIVIEPRTGKRFETAVCVECIGYEQYRGEEEQEGTDFAYRVVFGVAILSRFRLAKVGFPVGGEDDANGGQEVESPFG